MTNLSQEGQKKKKSPIFILGITKRSGTNFLHDLLGQHPDCHLGGPIWEHYLLENAELLGLYARFVYNRWSPNWKVKETMGPPDLLYEYLGRGLISFLNLQLLNEDGTQVTSVRLITKSPSVENLPYFFKLFPQAQLLIIIRDGRAVTESYVRSFKRSYETSIREWNDGAKTILQFEEKFRESDYKYLIVKYEDLFQSTETELTKIFHFLGLDVTQYDFNVALNLPIRGSSELTNQGSLHWKGVKKTPDFDPTKRWHHWGTSLHDRFNWVAGDSLKQLGYQPQEFSGSRPLGFIRNIILNIIWSLLWPVRRLLRKVKYMVGW
jgi:hypothetical protein